ncbi:unnamed protein product [Cylicostephanus goldi]|uniref:Uncharacterized protein n=1 Tax=Cylicostephanus goldi TaxID=71465 RepID=A0A3P6TU13_CYLGO|nr:unnamed protein product [Cylicostephanus goldi]
MQSAGGVLRFVAPKELQISNPLGMDHSHQGQGYVHHNSMHMMPQSSSAINMMMGGYIVPPSQPQQSTYLTPQQPTPQLMQTDVYDVESL